MRNFCIRSASMAAAAVAVAAILAGCGSSISLPDGSNIDTGDGKINVQTDEGEVQIDAGGGAELADGFPTDVPLPKDITIIASSAVADTGDGTAGYSVLAGSKESASDVTAYFKTQLPKDGWTIENEVNTGAGSVISATKDNRNLNIAVGGAQVGDSETSLTITVTD